MSRRNKRPFKIISKKTLFKGYVSKLHVLQLVTSQGKKIERELIEHPGAVVIIPELPDGRMILVRQLRIACGRNIWEFPAGTLEPGEATLTCAKRELREETGWRAKTFKKLIKFFPTPGISTEVMYIYLAKDMVFEGELELDHDEELSVKVFSKKQIERMIQRNLILDGKTILGFLHYQKHCR